MPSPFTPPAPTRRPSFAGFYRGPYRDEHRDPRNVALHVAGTVLGIAWLGAALATSWPWLALAFPIVHAAPGLVGHRLFERSAAVGDVRVTRRDFPLWWFIAANHLLVVELLRGALEDARSR